MTELASKTMTFAEMAVLYSALMLDRHDFSRGKWIVRIWDGMDGCWTDVTGETSAEEALKVWVDCTGGGKHHWRFDDIDYYRIFAAETRMVWNGEAGRELFRPPQTTEELRAVIGGILNEGEGERDDSK